MENEVVTHLKLKFHMLMIYLANLRKMLHNKNMYPS